WAGVAGCIISYGETSGRRARMDLDGRTGGRANDGPVTGNRPTMSEHPTSRSHRRSVGIRGVETDRRRTGDIATRLAHVHSLAACGRATIAGCVIGNGESSGHRAREDLNGGTGGRANDAPVTGNRPTMG